jgi:spermidine synthase
MLNALVGLWGTWLLRPLLSGRGLGRLRGGAVLVLSLLGAGLIKAEWLTTLAEEGSFDQPIVYARSTRYQRIVFTQGQAGFQLFLNGALQFNSADEYRYHEALVHPALCLASRPQRVLILGGGDALAAREVLKHPTVEEVTLVDIDPAMTALAARFEPLRELNGAALEDPRVEVVNEDALIWLERPHEAYDAAVIDFPDPSTFSLGKLYTTRFYRLLAASLRDDGVIGVQATSPLVARRSFWCVVRTLEEAGFTARPYHTAVPSFGVWGFVLACRKPFEPPMGLSAELKGRTQFLDDATLRAMFHLPADLAPLPAAVNRLDNQVLVRYYEDEWGRWQ